jgi:tetratricopeptide (TPR) repeat protein
MRRLQVRPWVAGLLLAVGSYLITFRAFVRPHVLSEFCLALFLYAYVAWRTDPHRRPHRWRLAWLVPVQLAWANSHSAVVFGLVLWAALVAGEAVALALAKSRRAGSESALEGRELAWLAGVGAVLLAVSFVNPNGWRVLAYPLTITGSQLFAGSIMELQGPLEAAFRGSDFLLALGVFGVAAAASFPLARRVDPARAVVVLVFGALALAAVRNIPPFAVAALPLVGANLEAALAGRVRAGAGRLLTGSAIAVTLALVVVTGFAGVRIAGQPRRPALGVDERVFPVRAAELIKRAGAGGNVFNTMEFGGYFIWAWYPERRVFIDGRLDVYGEELFDTYLEVLWTGPRWRRILDSLGVDWLVVARPPDVGERTVRYIGRQAGLDSGWALVQWDDVSLTYLRRSAQTRAFVESREFVEAKPYLLGTAASAAPDHPRLLAEVRRALEEAPQSMTARSLLGQALLANRQLDSAAAVFGGILARRPDNAPALQGLAMARLQAARVPEAIVLLERVVALEPDNGLALYNLGYARLQQADYERAAGLFERTLQLAPTMVPAHNMLGEAYSRQGRLAEARRSWETALRIEPGSEFAAGRLAALEGRGR